MYCSYEQRMPITGILFYKHLREYVKNHTIPILISGKDNYEDLWAVVAPICSTLAVIDDVDELHRIWSGEEPNPFVDTKKRTPPTLKKWCYYEGCTDPYRGVYTDKEGFTFCGACRTELYGTFMLSYQEVDNMASPIIDSGTISRALRLAGIIDRDMNKSQSPLDQITQTCLAQLLCKRMEKGRTIKAGTEEANRLHAASTAFSTMFNWVLENRLERTARGVYPSLPERKMTEKQARAAAHAAKQTEKWNKMMEDAVAVVSKVSLSNVWLFSGF